MFHSEGCYEKAESQNNLININITACISSQRPIASVKRTYRSKYHRVDD
jgi:hypothetical protein